MALPNRLYTNGFGGDATWEPALSPDGDVVTGVVFNFPVVSYEFTDANSLIDVTNSSSGRWLEFISGANEGSIALKLFWDSNNLYTGAAAQLIPGTKGQLTLQLGDTANGEVFVFPEAIIMSAKAALAPKAATTWDLEIKVTAPPDFPG